MLGTKYNYYYRWFFIKCYLDINYISLVKIEINELN